MGNNESDKLTKGVNLESFSSPYSPNFIINKSEFKGKSLKYLLQEHLNTEIGFNNQIDYNKDIIIHKCSSLNYSLFLNTKKDKVINTSIPSISTEAEEQKNKETKENKENEGYKEKIKFKINSISITTKNEIKKKEKNDKKIISKIIIEDDISKTKTTIFTTTSSLQKDINNMYEFKDIIGKGAFGKVRTGFRKKEFSPHKIYAIKSIYKKHLSKKDINNLEKEIDILSSLDHPNISRFYEAFHDEHNFNIVMELCRGKLLSKFLKSNGGFLDEKRSRIIIMKILHAINYCHSLGIVHCDLKPDNIIFELPKEEVEDLDNNDIDDEYHNLNISDLKIVDFGLSSRIKKNQKLKHAVGTPYFICPEMIRGEYDEKCDIWSIGVILYYMLSGKYPFNSEDNYEIFQKIETEQPSFWELNVSEDAIDFIGRCLRKNPKLRPSAKECLFHPWLEPIFTCIRSNSFLSENLITNFATYTKCPQLKKLILKYLISNMGHIELSPYKSAFYAFDFKNEGIVTVKDIKKIFDVYSLKITNSQIKKIMSICNEPNKRYLTYTEFILCCINIGDILTPEKLINAFFFFDMDNNLVIDSTDLKNVLLRCGKSVINEKDIDKILLEATKERDNKIGIEEFIKMYKDDIDVDEYINAINILLENNADIGNFL